MTRRTMLFLSGLLLIWSITSLAAGGQQIPGHSAQEIDEFKPLSPMIDQIPGHLPSVPGHFLDEEFKQPGPVKLERLSPNDFRITNSTSSKIDLFLSAALDSDWTKVEIHVGETFDFGNAKFVALNNTSTAYKVEPGKKYAITVDLQTNQLEISEIMTSNNLP